MFVLMMVLLQPPPDETRHSRERAHTGTRSLYFSSHRAGMIPLGVAET